jgi:alkylation response protein AidB-like acyl-CoA dehydrogenase
MDFDWTTEQREVADRVAAIFCEDFAQEIETLEQADTGTLRERTLGALRALAPTGYLSLGVGPEGRKEALALCAAREAPARVSASLFLALETSARAFGGLLKGFGRREAREVLWPQFVSGAAIGATAVSEEEVPGLCGAPVTRASVVDAGYMVTGRKSYVTNGPIADWFAVSAAVDDRRAFFFIPRDAVGLALGPRMETLGYRGTAVCSLELDHVLVPNDFTVGPFDDSAAYDHLRAVSDMILTAASVGLMERATASAKAVSSSQCRGGKPVSRFQENRFKAAEMATLLQTSQLLAYRAAWMCESGDPEAGTVTLCAKVFAAEASEQVASLAMQTAAAKGYISGHALERAFRDAKFAAMAGTTSELSRMAIADDLLKRCKV